MYHTKDSYVVGNNQSQLKGYDMTKIQTMLAAVMMMVFLFIGLSGDGYLHKFAVFMAGFLAFMLTLTAWMEWRGLDD